MCANHTYLDKLGSLESLVRIVNILVVFQGYVEDDVEEGERQAKDHPDVDHLKKEKKGKEKKTPSPR